MQHSEVYQTRGTWLYKQYQWPGRKLILDHAPEFIYGHAVTNIEV